MFLRWTRAMLANALSDEAKSVAPQRIGSIWISALYPRGRGEAEPFTIPAVSANGEDQRIAIRTGKTVIQQDESDFEDAK
ncbi:hypothetical protein BKG76_09110 [Mycobacteroides franklinii]|uniref:Uncharacterized protein n=1 Tax=Mycobacteroides franklinii TaxID=948102 RepID=A0A1S1L7G2_9MYCO|nr:hypothetical protein BKG76_09110 [Mycobacteroides franklinii]